MPPRDDAGAGENVPPGAFEEVYGEPLSRALDLTTWAAGVQLGGLYGELEHEISAALAAEEPVRAAIRDVLFQQIGTQPDMPKEAGIYQATLDDLQMVHRGLLFRGAVEACNGIAVTHDALAVSVTQVGVCLVSYRAELGSWVHRLFRRDLRAEMDPVEAAMDVIEGRDRGFQIGGTERLSDLARRGVMAYAERAALLDNSAAPWRLGHGNPVAYELLTGSGSMELLDASLILLERLLTEHPRFVFVPSGLTERGLLTLADALRPLEYAIVDHMTAKMSAVVDNGHYEGVHGKRARDFVQARGRDVVIGIYRASAVGPPRIFYAHADHAHEAALIAMADSVLHEHRGFPTLLELADAVCRATFGAGDFTESVRQAYAGAGQTNAFYEEHGSRR